MFDSLYSPKMTKRFHTSCHKRPRCFLNHVPVVPSGDTQGGAPGVWQSSDNRSSLSTSTCPLRFHRSSPSLDYRLFFFCTEAEACQQHKHQSLHLAVIDSTGGPQATPSCDVTIGSAIAHPRVGARATRRRLVTLLSR